MTEQEATIVKQHEALRAQIVELRATIEYLLMQLDTLTAVISAYFDQQH